MGDGRGRLRDGILHCMYGPVHTETFSCVFVLFTLSQGNREQPAIT